MKDLYRGIPKHKEPWLVGRRGSICPKDIDGVALFAESEPDPRTPGKRYATDGSRAYCAHSSNERTPDGGTYWHGFPYEWNRVPAAIQRKWRREGKIKRLMTR